MRYYVEEADIGNLDQPLNGPNRETRFFKTFNQADKEAQRISEMSNIAYSVWEFDGKIEDLKPRGKSMGDACCEFYGRPGFTLTEFNYWILWISGLGPKPKK